MDIIIGLLLISVALVMHFKGRETKKKLQASKPANKKK